MKATVVQHWKGAKDGQEKQVENGVRALEIVSPFTLFFLGLADVRDQNPLFIDPLRSWLTVINTSFTMCEYVFLSHLVSDIVKRARYEGGSLPSYAFKH